MLKRLTLVAPIDSYSGRGQHAIALVRGLEQHGIHVSIRPIRHQDAFGAKIPMDIRSKFVQGVQPEPVELLLNTSDFFPTPGKETVFLTTWESTKLPKRNVDALNKARVVVVPCHWNASCFSASGVTTNIRVVPHGIDPKVFFHRPMPEPSPFVFGCGGRLMNGPNRKGLHQIIRLFQVAFGDQNVRLRIKCLPDCMIAQPPDPRIELVKAYLPDHALAEWMAGLHCYVSFATGSWELMPHQAMAVGRPVLGINFAGMAEYLSPDASFILPHKLSPAGDSWTGHGCWGKAEDHQIIDAMRQIVADHQRVMEKGWLSHKIASEFTWEKSVQELVNVLNEFELLPKSPAVHAPAKPKCWVQLGRYGDIINILPILREEHRASGQKPMLMLSTPYQDILDGVTYVQPFLWDGDFSDLKPALDHARHVYPEVVTTQTYGVGCSIQQGDSFNRDQWRLAGYLDRWDDLPLVFDKRDFEREKALADSLLDYSMPNIVLCLSGNSSPFPHTKELKDALSTVDGVHILDISDLKAHRPYDLLGIFDRASLLILSDSAPLHLAAATLTPTIALQADTPSLWHGTYPRCRTVIKMPYKAVPARINALLEMVKTASNGPRLIHVYQDFPGSGDSYRRNEVARRSWSTTYAQDRWISASASLVSLPRQFQDDRRTLPYIRDLIEQGVLRSVSDEEVIVLTNTDTGLSPVTSAVLRETMAKVDAAFCYRKDFPSISQPLSAGEIQTGHAYSGCDLFAFRVSWWKNHRASMPDLLLGSEAVDWCLRELIRSTKGTQVSDLIFHEKHDTQWEIHRFELASNRHNHALAKPFLTKLGVYNGELEK